MMLERADLGGIVNVGAAAELDGLAAHVDHADHVAVLFAEQRDGALLLRLVDGHFLGHRRACPPARHRSRGASTLASSSGVMRGEVGEVKAQAVGST